MSDLAFPSFVALARARAAEQPDAVVYRFRNTVDYASLTYEALDRRARAIGSDLARRGAAGERVLILEPPGPQFVGALFGCLYAGAIAVPTFPPQRARGNRALDRLVAISANAGARFALAPAEGVVADAFAAIAADGSGSTAELVATESIPDSMADEWVDPAAGPNTIALLQYTSGSTSEPKGVVLSHGNLLHNSAVIRQAFGHSAASRGVIWLPPYHDMGLIGGILQPLFAGFPVTLMAPHVFLQHPIRWLQAVSETGATTSGGPNFGYDLCVRRTSPEERASLDLSTWSVAFNGAEPIDPATIERFVEAFAVAGFRRESFLPCYGLAEATLFVSGGPRGSKLRVLAGRADTAADQEWTAPRASVGCGRPAEGHEVLIVDPVTAVPCADEVPGEIWIAGPSIASGYWDMADDKFGAAPAGSQSGAYFRTGDLGYLSAGDLFVTGRLKELIIVAGQNHHPHDLERSVLSSHEAFGQGGAAAFGAPTDAGEAVFIAVEVSRVHLRDDPEPMFAAVRAVLSRDHGVQAHAIALLKPGQLPRTLSGKVKRGACRDGFLGGTLDPWAGWVRTRAIPETSDVHIS